MTWLMTNLATILVAAVVVAVLTAVIVYMIRQKKKGISACGCNCAACAMGCHRKQ